MNLKTLAALSAALMIGAASVAGAAELIVYHGWSTKAEVAALHVLQEALAAKGHTWKDLAIPHNSGVNVSLVNLVTGGDPPNAFSNSDPGVYRDLAGLGLERDLTDYYNQIGATDKFWPIIKELSTVDAYWLGHKDTKGMFAVDAGSTQGVAQTIKKYKISDKVRGGGYDLLQPTMELLQAGQIDFTIDQQPYLQGFLPVLELYMYKASQALTGIADVNTGLNFLDKETVKPYLSTKSRYEGNSKTAGVTSS